MAPSLLQLATTAALAASLVSPARAASQYVLDKNYNYTNFFSEFTFIDTDDLSNGYVDYQNETDAVSSGLATITSDNLVKLSVDSVDVPSTSARGRKSVRLEGTYDFTLGLIIADFTHLPQPKCGFWPAFWMYASPWPRYGEFDIYESYNLAETNTISLHTYYASTVGTCVLTQDNMTGTVTTSSNCDNYYSDPPDQYASEGCSVDEDSSTSPFTTADTNEGGVYAAEWTDDYIKVWSWLHGSEPDNLYSANPDPSTWGTPRSYVGTPNCDISSVISNQHLVLNLDFCGDAAGNTFQTCAATYTNYTASPTGCAAFVRDHPSEFANAYFEIDYIKIYEKEDVASSSSSSAISSSTSSSASSSATSLASATNSSTTATSTSLTSSTAAATTVSTTSASYGNATTTGTTTATTTATAGTTTVTTTGTAATGATTTATDGTTTLDPGMTTSVIYTTITSTIYSCAATVTNCPYGKVTTIVSAVTTTVCPITTGTSTKTGGTGATVTTGAAATTAVTQTLTEDVCETEETTNGVVVTTTVKATGTTAGTTAGTAAGTTGATGATAGTTEVTTSTSKTAAKTTTGTVTVIVSQQPGNGSYTAPTKKTSSSTTAVVVSKTTSTAGTTAASTQGTAASGSKTSTSTSGSTTATATLAVVTAGASMPGASMVAMVVAALFALMCI